MEEVKRTFRVGDKVVVTAKPFPNFTNTEGTVIERVDAKTYRVQLTESPEVLRVGHHSLRLLQKSDIIQVGDRVEVKDGVWSGLKGDVYERCLHQFEKDWVSISNSQWEGSVKVERIPLSNVVKVCDYEDIVQ